jgi:hypothetical protein
MHCIHIPSFSLPLKNWPNKLECYFTLRWKGFQGINILAYCVHSYVMKKMKGCVYDPKFHLEISCAALRHLPQYKSTLDMKSSLVSVSNTTMTNSITVLSEKLFTRKCVEKKYLLYFVCNYYFLTIYLSINICLIGK